MDALIPAILASFPGVWRCLWSLAAAGTGSAVTIPDPENVSHSQQSLDRELPKLNWELGMGWEWGCLHPRGSVTFGNGIVPIPGVVSPLGMGLSQSQGWCHPQEWDCPHPRGDVILGNRIVPIPEVVSPLARGVCLKAGWNSKWDGRQEWDQGMAVSTLGVTTGLSLPGDMAGGSWQEGTGKGHPWDSPLRGGSAS